MKKWVMPELYIEHFELTQTIATGCKTIYHGGEKLALRCVNPNNGKPYNDGSAHPDVYDYLADNNPANGKIDKAEWNTAVSNVQEAFAKVGSGHIDVHAPQLYVDDKAVELNSLFSS